jgi:hypothetical protein
LSCSHEGTKIRNEPRRDTNFHEIGKRQKSTRDKSIRAQEARGAVWVEDRRQDTEDRRRRGNRGIRESGWRGPGEQDI